MTVYLVGAGPGDPGLLTVRGAEVLGRAEVVVYDRLSVGSLLDLAPAGAERVNVGKAPGRATMPQHEINKLLVSRGWRGEEVVRLKGGDPFVFARGGEEAQALLDAGVAFEVVPGVTSAIAVPAYAGIPLTMRHSSTLFTVITGHEDPDKGGELDWETVAKLGGTIVVLMGIGRLPKIVDRLLAGGLAPDTPVAAITWGTRPDQLTVRATLATILDHDLVPPSTIVIGKVAAMNLDWFESRPLFGKKVIVTRAREQAPALTDLLRARGAVPVEIPVVSIVEASDGGAALRQAASVAHRNDWVVFTSANGVHRFMACLRDSRKLGGIKVAAVGAGTADALRGYNVVADLVPEEFVAEALVDAFPSPLPGDHGRILLAQAAVARDVIPRGLRAKHWQVDVVEAYRTVPAEVSEAQRDAVRAADAVTFTSSSTVVRFLDAFGLESVPPVVACIGPITAATAREHGIEVDVASDEHSVAGLVDALAAFLSR